MKPHIIFLICSGLDHINRGYESFSKECFKALEHTNKFEIYLIKGSGISTHKEFVVSSIQRNSRFAKFITKVTGASGYFVEQLSFFLKFIPLLFKYNPSLVYFSDFQLGTFCWHFRRLTGLKYKLLFSNGAPNGPPFSRTDFVQQLLPYYYNSACAGGVSTDKQFVVPYAINIEKDEMLELFQCRNEIRNKLGLPSNKKIILSVGAVNVHHKRMDYIVNEFSLLDHNEYFLLIIGQLDERSDVVFDFARELLAKGSYSIIQTESDKVRQYMCVSDFFILASLQEGLPRVLPEALSAGLLPIVHDYAITRETLGRYGVFVDLTTPGMLKKGMRLVEESEISKNDLLNYAIANYSWNVLHVEYEKMILTSLNDSRWISLQY